MNLSCDWAARCCASPRFRPAPPLRGARAKAYVIETDPPGAAVELSTGQTCTTPCALRLKRRPGFTVTITREGYETVTATIASGVSAGGGAAMAGNVILGGIIGGIVDGTNGSMNDLSPNPLRVNMVALAAAPAAEAAPAADAAAPEAAPADVPAPAGGTPDAAPQAD